MPIRFTYLGIALVMLTCSRTEREPLPDPMLERIIKVFRHTSACEDEEGHVLQIEVEEPIILRNGFANYHVTIACRRDKKSIPNLIPGRKYRVETNSVDILNIYEQRLPGLYVKCSSRFVPPANPLWPNDLDSMHIRYGKATWEYQVSRYPHQWNMRFTEGVEISERSHTVMADTVYWSPADTTFYIPGKVELRAEKPDGGQILSGTEMEWKVGKNGRFILRPTMGKVWEQ